MPAEYYLDTIRVVFQDHLLPHGAWDVAGERVDPTAIRGSALMTIEGELDDISGSGQTEAAHALCFNVPKDRQKHLEVKGAGHYGIFSGRRWRELVYPKMQKFIEANDQPQRRASARDALAAEDTVKPVRKSPAPAAVAAKKTPAKTATAVAAKKTAPRKKPGTSAAR
jgi:poly(3-hydroxybutyrate) depolymerase